MFEQKSRHWSLPPHPPKMNWEHFLAAGLKVHCGIYAKQVNFPFPANPGGSLQAADN